MVFKDSYYATGQYGGIVFRSETTSTKIVLRNGFLRFRGDDSEIHPHIKYRMWQDYELEDISEVYALIDLDEVLVLLVKDDEYTKFVVYNLSAYNYLIPVTVSRCLGASFKVELEDYFGLTLSNEHDERYKFMYSELSTRSLTYKKQIRVEEEQGA